MPTRGRWPTGPPPNLDEQPQLRVPSFIFSAIGDWPCGHGIDCDSCCAEAPVKRDRQRVVATTKTLEFPMMPSNFPRVDVGFLPNLLRSPECLAKTLGYLFVATCSVALTRSQTLKP